MQQTENYKLNKIDLEDSPADITVLNSNFDTIDQELNNINQELADVDQELANLRDIELPKKAPLNSPTFTGSPTVPDLTSGSSDSQIVNKKALNAALGNIDLLPVGTYIHYAGNTAPDGFILCNGANVSRTTYKELFAVIGTLYGAGDGSTTFTLPNLTGRFLQGIATNDGMYKSAGLPNINSTFQANTQWNWNASTGAITGEDAGQRSGPSGSSSGTNGWTTYTFNASKSNSIYGASTTVQPPSLGARIYIKY